MSRNAISQCTQLLVELEVATACVKGYFFLRFKVFLPVKRSHRLSDALLIMMLWHAKVGLKLVGRDFERFVVPMFVRTKHLKGTREDRTSATIAKAMEPFTHRYMYIHTFRKHDLHAKAN